MKNCCYLYSLDIGVVVIHRGKCWLNDHTDDADLLGGARSDFLKVLKHRVDHFEGLVNLFSDFGTS